jgi:hypothetical protein
MVSTRLLEVLPGIVFSQTKVSSACFLIINTVDTGSARYCLSDQSL